MRFVDLLRTAILLSAAAATALAFLTLGAATVEGDATTVWIAAAWWSVAAAIGTYVGRHHEASPPIARVLAESKPATMMPEHRPGMVIVNRLWPLLLPTLVAGGLGLLWVQVPAIAAGFGIVWALSWRHQHRAVLAVEERDGVTFFVDRTSPLRPIQLLRMPGFRRERLTSPG